jgi:class 3 adenylate cyclase
VHLSADSARIGEIAKVSTLGTPVLHYGTVPTLAEARTFLPRLAEHYLTEQQLPMTREIAVLFVDIADSTSTVLHQPPEVALALVQRFMSLVTEVALAHCGDVKDYEGDGALLYFGSVEQATRAALAIRAALSVALEEGSLPFQARLSANVGKVIIGVIGAPLRRSVALIGPTVSLASRLLKHIPPGGIVAPQTAIEKLRKEAPDLAEWFQVWGECLTLKGFEEECVTAYHLAPEIAVTADNPFLCNEQLSAWSSRCHRTVPMSNMLE